MVPLSPRYALPLLGLALLALGPIAVASVREPRDPCADPAALHAPPPLGRPVAWADRNREPEGFFQWTEGELSGSRRGQLTAYVLRSFDTGAILLHPQVHVGAQNEVYDWALRSIETPAGRIPVRVRRAREDRVEHLVAYTFVGGSRPLEHPLLAVLRSAPRRLLHGAEPLTLYWVRGAALPGHVDELERRAFDWLARALAHHRDACGADPSEWGPSPTGRSRAG